MWNEFKKFALKGNVIDLAVGVIIGAAFGKIVDSLVKYIMTPLLGVLLGGINVKDLHQKIGSVNLEYGLFLQAVIDFFIVSFSIFLFIKLFNKLSFKKEEEKKEEVPTPTKEEVLLTEIRDLLKQQSASRDNA
ncbi:large conductance mechanosensitive channel protein MscL [Bacillus sp. CGMCC 1.60114]|uniref:large conductance mechanosensitive channel protein MscL n=1 Tax=unclassified Bacillus (in: firmicutes) TaxID=185979 RepID=UPI00362DEA25